MEVTDKFLNNFSQNHPTKRNTLEGHSGSAKRLSPISPKVVCNSYEIDDFLQHDGKVFIENAYRLILKREPDPQAYQFYLMNLLEGKMTKMQVLYNLRYSDEGKSQRVKIRQLIGLYQLSKILNTRWLRPLFRILADLIIDHSSFDDDQKLTNSKVKRIFPCESGKKVSPEHSNLQDLFDAHERTLISLQKQLRDCQVRMNRLDSQVSALTSQGNTNQPPDLAEGEIIAHGFDYLGFENQLRGSEEHVKEHHRRYVNEFKGRDIVLDIGCGRGEFLELLKEAGVTGIGIDMDVDMVRHCRNKGLQVSGSDALNYLRSIPDNHLGGIFCAQVIEHLKTDDILILIRTAYQKLRPKGVFIIETLNPESLLVQYRWYWLDPTHLRLVHPEMLKFVFESAGFGEVSYQVLPAPDGPLIIPPLSFDCSFQTNFAEFNEATKYLNELLYSGFDYALRGIKP